MSTQPGYVDFHTHLHAYSDREALAQALAGGDIVSVACSMDIPSYLASKELARACPLVVPTFGIHPARADVVDDLGSLDTYLEEGPLIGEIGLDALWSTVPAALQEQVFTYILDHCHRYGKHCVIHTKGAERRVADILRDFPRAKPVIHWYHGPLDVYRLFLDRGYPQTFSCELRYSEEVREFARLAPAELLLTETDNPDSERWLGGQSDRPDLIYRVVEDLAAARGEETETVRATVWDNSMRILGKKLCKELFDAH